jgi:hypothetical protein
MSGNGNLLRTTSSYVSGISVLSKSVQTQLAFLGTWFIYRNSQLQFEEEKIKLTVFRLSGVQKIASMLA